METLDTRLHTALRVAIAQCLRDSANDYIYDDAGAFLKITDAHAIANNSRADTGKLLKALDMATQQCKRTSSNDNIYGDNGECLSLLEVDALMDYARTVTNTCASSTPAWACLDLQ